MPNSNNYNNLNKNDINANINNMPNSNNYNNLNKNDINVKYNKFW